MNGQIVIRALANGLWQVRVVKRKILPRINRKLGRKGQGLVEYILLIVLMGILAITAVSKMGEKTQQGFEKSTDAMDAKFRDIRS